MWLLLLACWQTDPEADFSVVPFSNPYASTEGVVETVETALQCPDGELARFYVVYPAVQTEPAPVAVVFHSGAFDFVLEPDPADPFAGQHWVSGSQSYSRLERGWGIQKTWETLGLIPQVDSTEDNQGALPSALLDAGFVGIYPINCWGDLWHNEAGLLPNEVSAEYFDRNGGAFSWWMARMLVDSDFAASQGLVTRASIDPDQLYLVGLGDGGRAVTEILKRDGLPVPAGILLDGHIDDLDQWKAEVVGVEAGVDRLYWDPEGGEVDLNLWTLRFVYKQLDVLDGTRIGLVHSSIDPRVPAGNLTGLLNAVDGDPLACVIDTEQPEHVSSNADILLAEDMVAWMLGEDVAACVE